MSLRILRKIGTCLISSFIHFPLHSISSCSSGSRNRRHRHPRRRHSSSSSGSSSTSGSPSIVTVDMCPGVSKRRRCSEACSASACAFDYRRSHNSHGRKHHRHAHSHDHLHARPHGHHWHRYSHHGHRHSHRKPQGSALEGDSQTRLMDWAVGNAEITSIGMFIVRFLTLLIKCKVELYKNRIVSHEFRDVSLLIIYEWKRLNPPHTRAFL